MIPSELRRWLAFGSGVGISIEGPRGAESLRVTAVRVRPSGVTITGGMNVENFRSEPAAEWGAAYAAMASKLGLQHVAATVVLPRQDVILRQLALPGIQDKDLDGAIGFQLDSLHPYDETEVFTSWARIEGSDSVAVAIARKELIDGYNTLFAEAGIKIAGFTCTGVAVHSGLRLFGSKPAGDVFAIAPSENGVEIYGESAAKAMFSAAFDTPEGAAERAIALAGAELRFENAPEPVELAALLGADAPRSYAAALTSACPQHSSPLNLLPLELRQGKSLLQWAPTVALATAVVLAAIGLVVLPGYRNGSIVGTLNQEIAKVQPLAARSSGFDAEIQNTRNRTLLLDGLRKRTKADMDVLAALTNLLQPPTWVQGMDINATQVSVTGETERAEPLLRLLDESPMFEASEFASPPSRNGAVERFNIRMKRSQGAQ